MKLSNARIHRVALLLLVGLTGCQCGPAATEPGPFCFEVPDFEPTLRGAVTQRTVTFFNDGDAPLRLVGLEVTPPTAFSLVGDSAQDVPAHGTATVDVKFAPTRFGPHAATLRFRLAAEGHQLAATLEADCIGPAQSVEPTQLDLGTFELYPGQTVEASAMLTVRNPGQGHRQGPPSCGRSTRHRTRCASSPPGRRRSTTPWW